MSTTVESEKKKKTDPRMNVTNEQRYALRNYPPEEFKKELRRRKKEEVTKGWYQFQFCHIGFSWRDLWLGVYWKHTLIDFIMVKDVWVCVIPCFPLHIQWNFYD